MHTQQELGHLMEWSPAVRLIGLLRVLSSSIVDWEWARDRDRDSDSF